MILSDNETIIDQLNNRAIAKTIVSIIKESKESVSIGVHGDWGAGKSSVLAMVEEELNPEQDEDWDDWENLSEPEDASDSDADGPIDHITTVRFNSWQYQGFEDAKIALMSAIVKALQNRSVAYYKEHPVKGALKKLKGTVSAIWDNLDKLSLAKKAGKVGIALATGTAPIALVDLGINHLKSIVTDSSKLDSFIEEAGELLKKSSAEVSSYKEMEEFRSNYMDLLKEAHILKIVVLIDDLDRCLPKVAIETLEAVRMFLALEKAVFIIAADDAKASCGAYKRTPPGRTDSSRRSGGKTGRR